MNGYQKMFEPIKIGGLEIPNRIVMAGMGVGTLLAGEGGFSQRSIDYYVERARGGAGLLVTGFFKVENEIEKVRKKFPICITTNTEYFTSTATELTEAVHAYNSKIFIQLSAGFGRSGNASKVLGTHPVAPSPVPNYYDPKITCRELKTEEVEQMVRAFAEASEIAVAAGFDGIEVHAAHVGYLVDQFTMALFNHRTDKYGGDLRGRLTFPIEILKAIKGRVGKNFPVILRYTIKSYIKDLRQGGLPGEEFKELGRDTEEGLEAAKILEEAGYDALDADAGSYDAWYWAHPPLYLNHGCALPLTEKLKKAVRIPVMVAGRMDSPEIAANALTDDQADMIVLGRGLLAEPYWPKKVKEGRIQTIRPCLACHDGCFLRMVMEKPISCAVNPACGREVSFSLVLCKRPKEIMVVGGGIAGMEAARVAASKGHSVALYEKTERLGGHLIAASVPDFKRDEKRLLGWYLRELDELDVAIKLHTEVSTTTIAAERPDAVIIATGSTPVIPNIPGVGNKTVITAIDLFLGKKAAGNSVVIVGGGLIGCETALWLVQQGKEVTIVEMLGGLMNAGLPVHSANKAMLIDLLKFHNVRVMTGSTLSEVTDAGALVKSQDGRKDVISADTIVIAVGLKSDQKLYRAIAGSSVDAYVIGDAQQARKIMHAVWDAYEIARNI